MKYDAKYFGDLFVATARSEQARRSFKNGVSVGTGHIPYDTGRTQNSIHVSSVINDSCVVEIGGDAAPYDVYLQYAPNVGDTGVPNRHRGFVRKFARAEFASALRKEFGKIEVK